MDELRKAIKGTIVTPAPASYARDYGNFIERTPLFVAQPESAEDVQAIVSYAQRTGARVVPRGHACTGFGQALSDQILLDMKGVTDFRIVSADTIYVGGGNMWGPLQDKLVSMGLSNRVLTDLGEHTIGGTLSVGGYGQSSALLGGQVDHVVSLDIVTGTGELIHATPNGPHADLFHYTLCGLGQTGIIVGAELKVEPLRAFTVQKVVPIPAGQGISEINDMVASANPSWEIVFAARGLDTGQWALTLGYYREAAPDNLGEGWAIIENNYKERFKFPDMLMGMFADVQQKMGLIQSPLDICPLLGDWHVPSPAAPAFCEKLNELFNDPRICPGHFGLVFKNARAAARLPLAPFPQADMVNSFTPLCYVPRSMLNEYQTRYEQAIDACLQANGRIYLYGYYPRTKGFFQRQFGEATFNQWQSVKQQYNASGIVGAELW